MSTGLKRRRTIWPIINAQFRTPASIMVWGCISANNSHIHEGTINFGATYAQEVAPLQLAVHTPPYCGPCWTPKPSLYRLSYCPPKGSFVYVMNTYTYSWTSSSLANVSLAKIYVSCTSACQNYCDCRLLVLYSTKKCLTSSCREACRCRLVVTVC